MSCDKCNKCNKRKCFDRTVRIGCECAVDNLSVCIPHYVVKTKHEARQFTNAFVDVISDNALYWVDNDGMTSMVFQRPIYQDNHQPVQGKYSNKQVIDETARVVYYYIPNGKVFKIDLQEVKENEDEEDE